MTNIGFADVHLGCLRKLLMHPEKPPAFFLYGFTLINPQMSCIKRGPIGLKMGHFNSFMLTYSLACTTYSTVASFHHHHHKYR